jgi:hypothetical protein
MRALSFLPAVMTNRPSTPEIRGPESPKSPKKTRIATIAAVASVILLGGVVAHLVTAKHAKPEIVSGRAAPKVTSSGADERWWQDQVTVTLDGSLDGVSKDARDAVEQAFGTWIASSAKLPHVTFDTRDASPFQLDADGENRIYFAPITIPKHENDLAITVVYTNTDTGEILEADMIVNSRHTWKLLDADGDDDDKTDGTKPASSTLGLKGNGLKSCSNTYDLRSVVTHEAGHFWGLGEDYTDTKATMFYSTPPCNVGKRELKTDDTQEVSSLYAKPMADSGGTDSTSTAAKACNVALGRSSSSGVFGVGLAALALAAVRRRSKSSRR